MSARPWAPNRFGASRLRRAPRRRVKLHRGERLEPRLALDAASWIGADGFWDDPANWSTGRAPTGADDATLNVPGQVTVTVRDQRTVGSIAGAENLRIVEGAGALTVRGASTYGGVIDVGGVLALAGDLAGVGTIENRGILRGEADAVVSIDYRGAVDAAVDVDSGRLTIEDGVHDGARFDVAVGAVLELAGRHEFSGDTVGAGDGRVDWTGVLTSPDPRNRGSIDFAEGLLHWVDGSAGHLINDGFVQIDTGSPLTVVGAVTNNGVFVHESDSTVTLTRHQEFINHGTYDFRGDGEFVLSPGRSALFTTIFHNLGTIRKSGGDGVSRIFSDRASTFFNNTGTADARTGTLSFDVDTLQIQRQPFQGDFLHGGTYRVADGATLLLDPERNIVNNFATVVLEGPSASMPGLDDLGANGGVIRLEGGRDFATVGDLTNGVERVNVSMRNALVTGLNDQLGVAVDPATSNVLLLSRDESVIREIDPDGRTVRTIPRPTEPTSGTGISALTDLDVASTPVSIGGVTVPAGALLMSYGDDAPPRVVALDRATGAELARVAFPDLPRGQPGLAHHAGRGTLFIMSSDNRLYEVDPASGALLNSFGLSGAGAPSPISLFVVGGVEVNEATGNLFVVVDRESLIRELTPTGEWVADYDLEHLGPRARNTVNDFSGIAIDNATGDAWIINREKRLWRFSAPDRGVFGQIGLPAGSTLTVAGAFMQEAGATTRIELAGQPNERASGRLDAVGAAALDGDVVVTTAPGFTPVAGDQYTVVSFAERGGTEFAAIATPDGFTSRHADSAVIATVGEPPVGSPDLVVSDVTGPTAIIAGERATIEWTVTNVGPVAATGPWRDAILLTQLTSEEISDPSTDTGFTTIVFEDSRLIADVSVGGEGLAPGASRTFTATVRVPARELGDYFWTVLTNARVDLVEESADIDLNTARSEQAVTLDVATLSIDDPVIDASFAAEGEPLWFRLDGAQDRDVEVMADLAAAGVTELYLGAGFLPTRFDYTHRHQQLGSPDVSVVAPVFAGDLLGVTTPVWYVTVFPRELAGEAAVQIAARRAAPRLTVVATPAVTLGGVQTLDVRGGNLSSDVTYRLVPAAGGVARDSQAVVVSTPERSFADFDLTGLAAGVYDLVVLDNGVEADRLVGGVTLVAPTNADAPAELRYWLSVPDVVRGGGRIAPISIHYENLGSRNAALPWLSLSVSEGSLHRSIDSSDAYGDAAITVLANGPSPQLTALPAGASGRIDLFYQSPQEPGEVDFSLHAASVDDPAFAGLPIDWSSISNLQRPAAAEPDAWDAFVARNRARYGETYADLHEFAITEIQELVADGYENVLFYDGYVYFEDAYRPVDLTLLRSTDTAVDAGPLSVGGELAADAAIAGDARGVGDAVVALSTPAGDGIAEVHTVVIGPNDGAELPGAQKDANAFEKILRTGANYAGPEPILVNQDDSTPENVLKALQQAANEVDADDTLLVYWASHGVCSFEPDSLEVVDAERDIKRPTNLFFQLGDGSPDQRVTPGQINEIVSGVAGQTAIVADTCYSGEILSRVDADIRIASAGIRTVSDAPSYGSFLASELQRSPGGIDLAGAARTAANKYVNEYLTKYIRGERRQALVNGVIDDLAGEKRTFAWPVDSETNQPVDSIYAHYTGEYFDQEGSTLVEQQMRRRAWRQAGRGAITIPLIDVGPTADPALPQISFKAKSQDKEDGSDKEDSLVGQTEGQLLAYEPVFQFRGEVRNSFDPNEKVGPAGVAGGFVRSGDELPYTVYFENDPEKATLPAQVVTITDALDADLDLTTFELGDILIGDVLIEVPAGRYAYQTTQSLASAGLDVDVRVDAELDFATRTVTWTFDTIDPETELPTLDALAGFLLVNDATRRGEGSVTYRVSTNDGLATGTQIANSASIVFDTNAALVTNTTIHTIDETAPTSGPNALPPSLSTPTFTVDWAGDDGAGSGVSSYDVYVSVDGGDFELLLEGAEQTSVEFTGEVGKTYAFSTVASDAIGFREAKTPFAETTTTIVVPTGGGGEIRGVSYVDVNNNGQIEPSELRLLGVPIELYQDGALVATTFTNAQGEWSFADLPAGTYTVNKVQPTLYFSGQETVGSLGGEAVADNQFRLDLGDDDSAHGYLFAERGLLPWYFGRSLYLASTPENLWEGVDLSITDQWIELTPDAPRITAWLGLDAAGGDARVELYDTQMQRVEPVTAAADATAWIAPAHQAHYLRLTGSHAAVDLALAFDRQHGDYNDDGVIDRDDRTVWAEQFGQSVAPSTGADGNGDGTVNAADYALWRDATAGPRRFGALAPSPFATTQQNSEVSSAINQPAYAPFAFPSPENNVERSKRPRPADPDTAAREADRDRAFALLLLDGTYGWSSGAELNDPAEARDADADAEPSESAAHDLDREPFERSKSR